VEMEALVAASVAALTVYDMCKALDKGIEIREVVLERKSGGKSGDYRRSAKAEIVFDYLSNLSQSISMASNVKSCWWTTTRWCWGCCSRRSRRWAR